MFQVDDAGNLIYMDTESPSPDAPLDSDSLYVPPAQEPSSAPPDVNEEAEETPETESGVSEGDPLPSPSPEPPLLDEFGNPVITPAPDLPVTVPVNGLSVQGEDVSLTTSGDVYIYPELPEDPSLPEIRSAFSANVTGLPNATSTQYLENVARGYPSHYKYMAFKSDANYSQSMVLWIGASGEKNPSQNRIDFKDVDCVEVRYIRSGNGYYYAYNKVHYDSYQVPYDGNVFLYTNVVDGYAEFDIPSLPSVSLLLFLAAAAAILFLAFRGGGRK